jgi:dipeptidyl-peptidase 4
MRDARCETSGSLIGYSRLGRLALAVLVLGLLVGLEGSFAAARSADLDLQTLDSASQSPPAPTSSVPVFELTRDPDKDEKAEVLTLDRIFPDKSFFGPSARSMSFSHDGRFVAFLYRPYVERRHGNDLYIFDSQTSQTRRMTSVGRMAEYQAATRKVQEDREKKAKKAGVSLSLLAREQFERIGLADTQIVGGWDGEAASEDQGIVPGTATVEITERANGSFTGELRIGLVRLTLRSIKLDEDAGTLEAKINDTTLKVKGDLQLTLVDGTLAGELALSEPEQKLALSFARRDPDEKDAAKLGPMGVLGAIGERLTLGDVVLDDDAEINDDKDGKPVRERAPRYAGISSIEWSPTKHELLLLSEGDIYRLILDVEEWDKPLAPPAREEAPEPDPEADDDPDAEPAQDAVAEAVVEDAEGEEKAEPEADNEDANDDTDDKQAKDARRLTPVAPYRGEITRLTRTQESMADVQYLPDGSGYTYLRGGALLRVSFGNHQIVQLDPQLSDGERMVGYRISPDMRRLVFLATRGETTGNRARQVTIVNYRDRFARAQQVTRHMPDDPWPESYTSIYLYDLRGHYKEDGKLERVFTRRVGGPRDVMRVPEWSPDSSRIAFAAFDQQSGHMKILEAGFVSNNNDEQSDESEPEPKKEAETENGTDETDAQPDTPAETTEEEDLDFKIENARVVYQFLHHGGPNTPRMVNPLYLPDSRRMVFITEISGYRQLHQLEPRYEQLTQITAGQFEVYPFHLTRDHSTLFATTTNLDPAQEHVYKIDLNTHEVSRLTTIEGVYRSPAVRDDGSLVVSLHADFGSPTELIVVRPGEDQEERDALRLTDSHPQEAHKLTRASPEYFTYENRHGQTIHGHLFKPADWTLEDKRPLLIYVYGGPLSANNNMITRGAFSAPSYFFARYMAQKHGFVTATIDPRGASGFGAVFEKANFEQVGKPQTEDLVDGARWLVKNHGVDESRMALHGWSFGGFQTQMVMYTEPDVFAVGIAGAGPTEWHNYNSWYSTGTIGPNRPGRTDLEQFSLLPLAKNLKGKLLLVHGVEDSNVLYQDTVRVYRELLKANKEVLVELFIDPTGGHGLGGDVKTIGRYRKYEDFLVRNLGTGAPAKAEDKPEAEPEEQDAPAAATPPTGEI